MRYAVDPCLVTDILDGDPEWGERSARLFDAHQGDTLVMSSLAYLSLAPAFGGRRRFQDEFLAGLGISAVGSGPETSFEAAYDACSRYHRDNPDVGSGYMPLGLFASGVVALACDGILTRHAELYRRYFPSLKVSEP